MCGRYALGIRAAFVRHQFQQHNMPVDEEAPEDDEVRETYNFAPGSHGLIYRADTPDTGARRGEEDNAQQDEPAAGGLELPASEGMESGIKYKLQAMKWGLVPFWTKRSPDYGSVMKTINARDDSLAENRGMWNSMKRTKRCIVVAQGFYEWLKKNNGKEKIPHFVKRKDEQLMCFAGLWDCVKYDDSEEKHFTYTIITTDSNKQLNFLHDRMPVILENGSEALRTWLDPKRTEWTKELQSLLKPFGGELECYPVSKDVGKVGNNSPDFIVPVASSQNKNNIANFFANAKKNEHKQISREPVEEVSDGKPRKESDKGEESLKRKSGQKNEAIPPRKAVKIEEQKSSSPSKASARSLTSPDKAARQKKVRSATSNGTTGKGSPTKAGDGSQRITSFFGK